MILKFEEIQLIITKNPNKALIEKGKKAAVKYMLHLHGVGLEKAIKKCDEFSSDVIHSIQQQWAISNKDFFQRLLSQEDMIFSARGGSTHFNLPESDEATMHEIIGNVRYGYNLRKWIKNFALNAYRCDPMGIIFMEQDQLNVTQDGNMNEPMAYPTYKGIHCIYDYASNGRNLEYVVFKLKACEARAYGIVSDKLKDVANDTETDFYRVVDDIKDVIVERNNNIITLVTSITQKNPLINPWKKTPGFIVSDLIKYDDPKEFVSPLDFVVELADCFLYDRSIRDLQKKYHGFAKAVEPLMQCPTCTGTKFVGAEPCPSCTPAGGKQGTGYKTRTKISDVARFPLEIFENGGFDFRSIFGYVTPNIESWEKQDRSLDDLEQLAELTYWGTIRLKRPQPGQNMGEKTATEVNSNDAPREARLNLTADWAETTENMIADFLGQFWFESRWKGASISYGRDYILKTADELLDIYEKIRSKGAPDFLLDDALEKYLRAKYQNNPIMMAKYLKMLNVEPFPHLKISEAKNIVTDFTDYNCKLYFGEWSNSIKDGDWIMIPAETLRGQLKDYVKQKALVDPATQEVKPGGIPAASKN